MGVHTLLRIGLLRLLAFSAGVVLVAAYHAGSLSAARPLTTAIADPYVQWSPEADLALKRTRGAGATLVRFELIWRQVAPTGPVKPPGFDGSNPLDPRYDWSAFDRKVRLAASHDLVPIAILMQAPDWAERTLLGRPGSRTPDPLEFAAFARAAALRYSGAFDPDGGGPLPIVPAIKRWEIWNEPNLSVFFNPQRDPTGGSIAPTLYRALVNTAAAALHRVDRANIVVAGVLAPFGPPDGHMPMDFMRRMLCLSSGEQPEPVCTTRVEFDVWSHHPYTSGGPNHKAYWTDDASLGDLGEMRRALTAAVRAGHIVGPDQVPKQQVPFWVTEFSWESRPPDPLGLAPRVHARWTAEALYRMWSAGVSLVTWWQLRDRAFPEYATQSGLYYCGKPTVDDESRCGPWSIRADKAKRSLRAFRFPFVALPRSGRLFVWGRTPAGRFAIVVIEVRGSSGWRRIGRLRADRNGIFQRTFSISAAGRSVRARLAGRRDASVAFRAARTRDVPLAHPFGCGGGLPC
jgi:hypothetical protein